MFRNCFLFVGIFVVQSVVLGGCGEDPVREFRIFAVSDKTTLPADGSDTAEISIQVVDRDNQPANSGSRVSLYGYDTETNEPYGIVGDSGANQRSLYLDTTGSAATSFTCSGVAASAAIMITHDSNARIGLPITCQ